MSSGKLIIGASLGGFVGRSMDEAIRLCTGTAESTQLNAVEVLFERQAGRASMWSWEAEGELRRFMNNFEISGVHLPFLYLHPISPNPGIRQSSVAQLKDAVGKAAEMGADYAVIHANGSGLGLSHHESLERWAELFDHLAVYAGQNSIVLAIENADLLWNLQDVIGLLKRIDSAHLRMTLDIGHAHARHVPPLGTLPVRELSLRALDTVFPFFSRHNMPYQSYGSLKSFLKSERKWIHCLHMHDYDGRHDHLPLGKGKIDFSFLSELKDFEGPYILEMKLADPSRELPVEYARLKKLLECR